MPGVIKMDKEKIKTDEKIQKWKKISLFLYIIIIIIALYKVPVPPTHYINIDYSNSGIVITGKNLEIRDGEGESMLPTIIGKTIIEKNFNKNDIKVGDIIQYRKNDHYVVHRVIWRDENNFIAKGDHNITPDLEIYPISDVVGIVVAVIY